LNISKSVAEVAEKLHLSSKPACWQPGCDRKNWVSKLSIQFPKELKERIQFFVSSMQRHTHYWTFFTQRRKVATIDTNCR
jgi:hypothetical protein